jgi:hypothetical protein
LALFEKRDWFLLSLIYQKKHKNQSEGIVPQNSELINQFIQLLELHRSMFGQERVFLRMIVLVIGEIFAFKTHRITDLLRAMRLTDEDWSGWYRLFEDKKRYLVDKANETVFEQTLEHVGADEVYVIGGDCTQVWRDSRRMEGSSWLKCPRNPPWRIGIHRAQRFLNGSWLTPLTDGFSRAIPLVWWPAFPEKAVLKEHKSLKEHLAGVQFVQWVKRQLTRCGRPDQRVLALFDGSYDKPEFWRDLPKGVTALVRTAKNRALYYKLTAEEALANKKRKYGDHAPAPQDYLKERPGWKTTTLTVRGRHRRTVFKVVGPLLRRPMSDVPLFLICVRGQQWRTSNRTKRREPVYYLVNAEFIDDRWQLPIPVETLLCWAWQRWELEVVHREVKSLFGLGDKQCFQPHAAVVSVQWSAWLYALISLAAYRTYKLPAPPTRSPAWYPHPKRWTLSSVLDSLRADLWTDPDFLPLFSQSPTNWAKIQDFLEAYWTRRRILSEPAA